jgi:hypothetical protein
LIDILLLNVDALLTTTLLVFKLYVVNDDCIVADLLIIVLLDILKLDEIVTLLKVLFP